MGFYCNNCGKYHNDLPLSYNVPTPIHWRYKYKWERHSELGTDLCVIRGENFFIRGNVEIPIIDSDEIFGYSVWVSLSQQNFERTRELWFEPKRVEEEPYFGWFSSQLPNYPDTINLKTLVHTRPVGIVPYIELEGTDHPLAVEQREGITMERVQEIAELNLHHDNDKSVPFWKRLLR